MLIRFEVANFRSILDPVELSFVAVDRDRPEARPFPNIGESLVPVTAVYGANASGKSNVLVALDWLWNAVLSSLRFWDDEIPVEPFAFDSGMSRPSEFTLESMVAGVRFEYTVVLDRESVHYESLFHYPEKKRRRIFERENDELKLQRGLGAISGARELLTGRTLALSAARRFDEDLVRGFAGSVLTTKFLGPPNSSVWPGKYRYVNSTRHLFEQSSGSDFDSEDAWRLRNRALSLLRMADPGIDDVVVDEYEVEHRPQSGDPFRSKEHHLRLVHRSGDDRVPFDLSAESTGTRTWFHLIGPVLDALESGSAVVFDELDASLHPSLSAQLIRLFHDQKTNPEGAQLIFSSHDTSLLDHLNRDEVWLTEKRDGATTLTPLSDFAGERVRNSRDLERGYLNGRFGALPEVDRTEMLRALGLIG